MTAKLFSVFDNRQLAHAPAHELHNGGWADYQETPARAVSIYDAIGTVVKAQDWGHKPLEAVHDADYLAFLKTAHAAWAQSGREGDAIGYVWPVVGRRPLNLSRIDARLGRFSYDSGTPIAEHSWESAYWSAQTALTALDGLLSYQDKAAFALCRPPGHHAGRDYLGGYCYLNNAAIAAREAQRRGAGPVAILDIDYHHGNGTRTFSMMIPTYCSYRFTLIQQPTIPSIGAMQTSAARAQAADRRLTSLSRVAPILAVTIRRWRPLFRQLRIGTRAA